MTAHLELDDTHDPALQSWVESANDPSTDFPIQNLPFGVFRRRGQKERARIGVAIGSSILDVGGAHSSGLLREAHEIAARCHAATLNGLMATGREGARLLRRALSELLRTDSEIYRRHRTEAELQVYPMDEADMLLPARIGDYTDFYASIHHARNVGSMFRPDNPLLPNYQWVPIGYHGRASSVVPSGWEIRRPRGQRLEAGGDTPVFGASERLDYELEVGAFVGSRTRLGEPIPIDGAEEHIFGLCLVNDWSARDIQAWEYQPLGPFLSKSFATSISPWVVTLEALAPFRAPAASRASDEPRPLDHLFSEGDQRSGGFDIHLEVLLSSAGMRAADVQPARLSRGSFQQMYWTLAQMVTHHSSNGCNLRAGDLIASGTVSGEDESSRGCLLELAWRGERPVQLPNGESRRFLEDGDEVVMRGWCEREGARRIGFGECVGRIVGPDAQPRHPAVPPEHSSPG
jgi:fumarylacetoacetase